MTKDELSLVDKIKMYYGEEHEKIRHRWIIDALNEARNRPLTDEAHEWIEMELMKIMRENAEIINKENVENVELIEIFGELHSRSQPHMQHHK